MKTSGEWRYSSIAWPRQQMEVSGQRHAPAALPPGERAHDAPRAGLDAVKKRRLLALPGLEALPSSL
jgi:hypothetical protein